MNTSPAASAFEKTVIGEVGPLYGLARRMAPRDDPEDLVQETMTRAFGAFDPASPPAHPKAWIHKIMLNIIRDRSRAAGRRPGEISMNDTGVGLARRLQAGTETGAFSDPSRLVSRWNRREALAAAFAELPDWAREILLLFHSSGLSYREISEALDLPQGTVMSRLNRARGLVQDAMAVLLSDPSATPAETEAPDDPSLRTGWGAAPAAVDAMSASPGLAASVESAGSAVTEDGALTGETKRRLMRVIDGSETPESDDPLSLLAEVASRAVRDPGSVTQVDHDRLAAVGWSHPEVVEALHVANWTRYLANMNAALGGGTGAA